MTDRSKEIVKDEEEVLINADRDQFLFPAEAIALGTRINNLLFDAKATFSVAVVLSQGYMPYGEYVTKGDDPGEELYNLVWAGVTSESAGIFAAYANRGGWNRQILKSLKRLKRKGFSVGWWITGYFENQIAAGLK